MDVIMPQMGESIAEGTIVKWLKKPGDRIEKDEPLFEISTDKVDAEIPSPAAGVLSEILVLEGNTVGVNTVVARIGGAGAKVEPPPSPPPSVRAPAAPPAPPAPRPVEPPRPVAPRAPQAAQTARSVAPPPAPVPAETARAASSPDGGGRVSTLEERVKTRSSPLVRRIAAEHGIDIGAVPGTGIHGRVTKDDILGFLEKAPSVAPSASTSAAMARAPMAPEAIAPPAMAPVPPPPARMPSAAQPLMADRVEPMSVMRLKIAEHMVASRHTSAHVQTFWEVDVSNLARIRDERGEEFLRANGVKLSYTSFIAKAVCDALKTTPIVNASIEGTNIRYHGSINLGIAVALDWGLIVPVIKGAGDMNLSGLGKAIADLAGRARSKRLSPDEVTGGTFTITNPGIYGGLFGCPIINQPQAAILGVGAIEKRPVVIDDAIAIRPMCYLSLSFDHRLIDGSVAEQFMGRVKESLLAMTAAAL